MWPVWTLVWIIVCGVLIGVLGAFIMPAMRPGPPPMYEPGQPILVVESSGAAPIANPPMMAPMEWWEA